MSEAGGSSVDSGATSGLNLQTVKPGQEEEVSDDTRHLQQGMFGVGYTVAKEKAPTWRFAAFRLFLDFLQLFLLTVNPQYGFTGFIDNSNIGWQVVSFIGLNQFLANRGYLFFIVALYIMAGALLFNVVLCVWVGYSFQANSFNHVWPIVWLRWFGKVFYQVLDIATLSLFLVALDCQLYGRPEVQGVNQQFPNVYCWSGAHVIHASVAAVSIIVFIAFAAFFTLAEMELNPLSRNPLAMAHSGVEVLGFGLKSLMTLAATFLSGTRELSLLYLACSLALLYLYVYWVPHLNPAVNMIRTASYAMVMWTSLVLVLLAFKTVNLSGQQSAEVQQQLTLVMWVGLAPAGLAGALAGWMRLRYFMVTVVNRFRHAPPDMKPRLIFNATDAREVEILSRCCRVWQPEDPEVVEEEAMELASIILKAGLAQLAASDPYMIILYASFLIDVQNSTQSGYTQLQAAKRANPSFLERFAIFTLEQQHIQQSSHQTGKATDLVAYVESMRSYNLVYKAHKDALLAMRAFWAQLLNSKIKFETLSQLVAKLDTTIKAAEQAYKQVLGRHGTNVRLLRLYAKFLEHIKHDPWTAAKWFAEADALEQEEEKAKDTNVFTDMTGVDPGLRSALTEIDRGNESRAIIIINARCIIQVVNQVACDALGYSRNELKGRNVNNIMPHPFCKNHDQFVRNYVTTGKAVILGDVIPFVALHRERYTLAVTLQVTQVSGIGEDAMFMGVVVALPQSPEESKVWLMLNLSVVSVCPNFTDWTALKPDDVAGMSLKDLVVNYDILEPVLTEAKAMATAMPMLGSHQAGPHMQPNGARSSQLVTRGSNAMREPHVQLSEASLLFKPPPHPPLPPLPTSASPLPPAFSPSHPSPRTAQLSRQQSAEPGPDWSPFAVCQAEAQGEATAEPAPAEQTGLRLRHSRSLLRNTTIEQKPGAHLNWAEPANGEVAAPGHAAPHPPLTQEPGVAGARSLAQQVSSSGRQGTRTRRVSTVWNDVKAGWDALRGRQSVQLPSELQPRGSGVMQEELRRKSSVTAQGRGGNTNAGAPAHDWLAPSVLLQHKYHTPVQASIRITVGGVGKFRFLLLTIRRGGQQGCASQPTTPQYKPAPAPEQPRLHPAASLAPGPAPPAPAAAGEAKHLLVTDRKGRVCHATKGLAAALRTTTKAIVAGAAANALENLLPQPLALLHRSLAMSIPLHSPPAYSCRSGLAVPLLISGVRDNDSAPFRLRMYQQDKDALGADEVFHVTTLCQASMTEALAERCLSLVVDPSTGRVLSTGSSPLALFGYHPQQLLGSCLADLLDVLQPPQPGAQDKTSRDKTGPGSYALAVLAHMAAEAFSRGEVGFRAGLLKPASQVDSLLSSVAHLLTPADATACQAALPQLHPALMVVRPHLPDAANKAGIHQLLHPPPTQPGFSHVMSLQYDKSDSSAASCQDGSRSVAWAGWQPGSQQHVSDAAVHICLTQAPGQVGQHRREAVKQAEGSCLYRHVSFSPPPTSTWLQQRTKAAGNPSAQGPAASSLGLPTPSPVLLEVHLWRAELACSVLELNEAGQVVGPDAALPLYPPGLLFGVHTTQLVGRHISHFLPDLASMGDLSCLLEPVPPPGTVQLMHSPQGLVPAASAAAQTGRKGVLKSVVSLTAAELQQGKKPRVGPLLLLAARQHSEGTDMEVSVQAVRKSSGNGMWLVMHPYQPRAGRPDLGTWLAGRRLGAQAHVAAGVAQVPLSASSPSLGSVARVGSPSSPVPASLPYRVANPRPGPNAMSRGPQSMLLAARPSVNNADGPEAVRGVGFLSLPAAQLGRQASFNPPLRGLSCPVIQEASLGNAGTSPRLSSWQQQPAGTMPRLPTSHAQEPLPAALVPTSQQAPGNSKDLQLPAGPGSACLQLSELTEKCMDQLLVATDESRLDGSKQGSSANTAPVAQWVLSDGAQFMTDRPPHPLSSMLVHGVASSPQHTYLRAPSRVSLPKLSSFTKSGRVHPEASRELVPGGQDSSGQLLVEAAPYGGPGSARHSHGQGVEADIVDGSDDAEGNRLDAGKSVDDQAELGVADYNRGKRYKRLARMLASPLVQRHITRFRVGALVLVAIILAAHIAVFAILYSLIESQSVGVIDLNNAGVSIRRAVEVSRAARWLDIILDGKAAVNPNLVGLQPTPADLKAMLAYYQGQLTQAATKHKAFYMGDGQPRALPTTHGLGKLWGQDSVTATVWYEVPVSSLPPGANITTVVTRDKVTSGMYIKLANNKIVQLLARHEEMSLWEMGNMMFANMDEVWRLATNVSASGRQLDSWPPFRNSIDSANVLTLSERYMDTMDAMVQIVGDHAVALDKVLLIAMGAKGVALTLVLTLVLWSLAQRVGGQRYMIYSLFMVLPVGLVRGLATAKHNLEADGQEDEDDDMLAIAAGEASGTSGAVRLREAPRASEPGAHLGYSSTGQMTLNIPSLKTAAPLGQRAADLPLFLRVAKQSWGALVALCMPWLTPHQVAGAKRQLIPSNRQAVQLTWPLLLWGLVVVIINIITHEDLVTIGSSVFVYNSVNFVSLIAKISLYTWQELLVAEDVDVATQLRQQLSVSHKRVEVEYNVLLYGNMADGANTTIPHFANAGPGLANLGGRGTDLLFSATGCMRANQSSCLPPTSPYYGDVTNGIDRWVSKLLTIDDTLMMMNDTQPGMGSSVMEWLWLANDDRADSMTMLNLHYQGEVLTVFYKCLQVQTASFALTWVILVLYLLLVFRPFLNSVKNETKRVAELLSQLPAEVDVEGLVQRLLIRAVATAPSASRPPLEKEATQLKSYANQTYSRQASIFQ